MSQQPDKQDESNNHPGSQEKEVTTVAVRLPIVILVAVLLMLAVGVWAQFR